MLCVNLCLLNELRSLVLFMIFSWKFYAHPVLFCPHCFAVIPVWNSFFLFLVDLGCIIMWWYFSVACIFCLGFHTFILCYVSYFIIINMRRVMNVVLHVLIEWWEKRWSWFFVFCVFVLGGDDSNASLNEYSRLCNNSGRWIYRY